MQIADHFTELWSPGFGNPRGSVREFILSEPYADQQKIADYLRAGHEIIAVMGASEDRLGSDRQILGGDSLYTDGQWLWRGDLYFYVQSHHVALPDEFVARIRSHMYSIPSVERARLLEVSDYVDERW